MSCFIGAYKQMDFLVKETKYRKMVKIFSENAARIFYMIFGITMVIIGIAILIADRTGVISFDK